MGTDCLLYARRPIEEAGNKQILVTDPIRSCQRCWVRNKQGAETLHEKRICPG